MRIPKSCVV